MLRAHVGLLVRCTQRPILTKNFMEIKKLLSASVLFFAVLMAQSAWGQQTAHRVEGWRIFSVDTSCVQYVSFPVDNPQRISIEDSLPLLTLRAAERVGDSYYLLDSNDGLTPASFLRYDIERHRLDTVHTYRLAENESGFIPFDMAFDPTTNQLFLLAFDIAAAVEGDGGEIDEPEGLYVLNTTTGRCTLVGLQDDVYLISIAIDADGQMVGLSADGSLYNVDKETFQPDKEAFGISPVTPSSLQTIAVDATDGKIYWTGFSESEMGFLGVFNRTQMGTVYNRVGLLADNSEIIGTHIVTSPLPRTVPSAPTSLTAQAAAGGASQAVLRWTMPQTDLDGNTLEGELAADIYRNGALAVSLSGLTAGQVTQWRDGDAQGLTEYKVQPRNASGTGRAIYADTIFVGVDCPGRPVDVRLEKEGGSNIVTLWWDAPETGAQGGWYDATELTYRVVRQPDGVCLAEGLTACTFTDRTITQAHAYYYEIMASTAAGDGPAAQSPTVVAGGSLPLPYACDFSHDEDVRYWTVVDGDGDGYKWGLSMNYNDRAYSFMRYFPDVLLEPTEAASEWLISPPLALEAGKHYRASWQLRTQGVLYPLNYELTLGNAPVPEAQTAVIASSYQETNGGNFGFVDKEALFEVPSQGASHMAFHVLNRVSAHVTNVCVEEVFAADLALLSLEMPNLASMDKPTAFVLKVKNNGYEAVSGYTLSLLDADGHVRVEQGFDVSLSPGEVRTDTLRWSPSAPGFYPIGAKVTAEGDSRADNDTFACSQVEFVSQSVWYDYKEGNIPTRTSPFTLAASRSFSQSIYLPDHIGAPAGMISALKYYYRSSVVRDVKPFNVKVYMANTDEEGFDLNYPIAIPKEQFTQVFHGNVSITESEGSITLRFDTPFEYNGGGLCVMLFKEGDTSGEYIDWLCYYRGRDEVMHTIYYSGGVPYDFLELPTSSPELPNASFYWTSATGISQPSTSMAPSEVLYDLQGRRLTTAPARGIYLQGGRKKLKY